jgi:hypothetical protein
MARRTVAVLAIGLVAAQGPHATSDWAHLDCHSAWLP